MASIIENLLEPQRMEVAADARWWLLLLALAGTIAGGAIICLLIRRMGAAGPGLSRIEALLVTPIGVAFVALSFALAASPKPDSNANPLLGALIQIVLALGCILALVYQPLQLNGEGRGTWYRADRRLLWVPLLWLGGIPLIQLATFASVVLHQALGASIDPQGVVENLRADRSPEWIFAWYVMAVVAAPLMEEFVFRLALFGGIRRLLEGLSSAQGWRHPAAWIALCLSIAAFVLAHGVWGWTVGILPLTVLSVFLTMLYAHTRSIWPGVLYHALHNAVVVTVQFFVLG